MLNFLKPRWNDRCCERKQSDGPVDQISMIDFGVAVLVGQPRDKWECLIDRSNKQLPANAGTAKHGPESLSLCGSLPSKGIHFEASEASRRAIVYLEMTSAA